MVHLSHPYVTTGKTIALIMFVFYRYVSFCLFFWLHHLAYGILVYRPEGSNLHFLQWKLRVLTTGHPWVVF